ncbi:MAG: aminoglycoside phosphotransferase family protein [Clostridiales bacterium]
MELVNCIACGRTSEIFEYDEGKIVKLFLDKIPKSDIENEFYVSQNLFKENFPVAKAYKIIKYKKRYGIVYEKINGKTMLSYFSFNILTMINLSKAFAKLQNDFQKEINFSLHSYKKNLVYNINQTRLLNKKLKQQILDYTEKLPEGNLLCHGDFHPDNIIITDNGFVVIDWLTASVGSKYADFSRTVLLIRYGSIPKGKTIIENIMINSARRTFLNKYIKKSNINIKEVNKWILPVAAGRLNESIPEKEKLTLLKLIEKNKNYLFNT